VSENWSWVDDDDSGWVPPSVDTSRPSAARIYDFALGGKDNYPVDREVAARIWSVIPDGHHVARANRQFLVDAVETMAAAGIRQFVDLGTGIPTSPNVHETARAIQPDAAVVYVDNDPLVLAHNRALMHGDPLAAVLPHDMRDPASVLDDPVARQLIDFDQPIGLLMIAVLHFVDVSAVPHVVERYVYDLPPGSQVAITAVTSHGIEPGTLDRTLAAYEQVSSRLIFRTRAEVDALFGDLSMVRPLDDVYRSPNMAILGGTAIKP